MHRPPGWRELIMVTPLDVDWYKEMRDRVRSLIANVLKWEYEAVHWVYQDWVISAWAHWLKDALEANWKNKKGIISPVPSEIWTPKTALYVGMELIHDSERVLDYTKDMAFVVLGSLDFAWETKDILNGRGLKESKEMNSDTGTVEIYNLLNAWGSIGDFHDDMFHELLELRRSLKEGGVHALTDFEKYS